MIAAITAGGRVHGALARAMGTTVKALAPLGSGTLLDVAIAAARGCGPERIVVVGGAHVREACERRVDAVLPESSAGRENLRRALLLGASDDLLLLTSDLPFLRSEDVRAFLERSAGADIALPLAGARAYEAAFPGAPPHAIRLGRERVVNGSVFYFARGVAPRALLQAERLFEARKSLVRMAALLGPALLLRFAVGRLAIPDVEARAQAVLGLRARALRDASPRLCFDVDTLEDYRFALARTPY